MEDTMDEIREQMDLASEVSNAISSPIGFGMQIDDVSDLFICFLYLKASFAFIG